MFTSQIRFGTDGWRSRMDVDFNAGNVRRIAHAVGMYLKSEQGNSQVLVGFDTRANSEYFAKEAAGVLSKMDFRTKLTDRPTPTPVIAFSVVDTKSAAAVQITASHNPPVYNGFKFIPEYGGPAFAEITARIEGFLPSGEIESGTSATERFNPESRYLKFLEEKINVSFLKGMKVIADPLYGAGYGYLSSFLARHGAKVTEIHGSPDPQFGGLTPEPTEINTRELSSVVVSSGADLGIANDGDADRFAARDDKGNFYSSNQLVLVIADYLVREKNLRGKIVKSVSTTVALERLCRSYGLQYVETPVGFKYSARELMNGAIIGAEESGGLGYGWSVPEKDGIMSGAILCEALGHAGKKLREVWEAVSSEYGYGIYYQYNLPVKQEIKNKIENLRQNPPDTFGGRKVAKKTTIDGLKLTMDDDSWILLRPSGTEPLIRVYIEARDQKELEELRREAELIIGPT